MKTSQIYEDFANDAVAKLPQEDRASFDPITILMIIGILVGIARLIVECRKKGADAKKMAQDPNVYEKRVLRKKLREALGVRRGGLIGDKFGEAVLEVASGYSEEKLQEMLDKANEGN